MKREFNFTKRSLDGLPVPSNGPVYHYDLKTPHLAVCVTKRGSKTFYRCGRIDGRPERIRLGPYPAITIAQARQLTKRLTGTIADGKNPQEAKRSARNQKTLLELFEWYIGKPLEKTQEDLAT